MTSYQSQGIDVNVDINVTGGSISSVSSSIGGVVGYNANGLISNVAVEGQIGRFDFSTNTLYGVQDNVGGIAGSNSLSGQIVDSLTSIKIRGRDNVGGVVGFFQGGDMSNPKIDGVFVESYRQNGDSDNTLIVGRNYVGGIAGYNNKCYVECCYFNGKIYGDSEVGGIVGTGYNIENCYVTGYVKGNSYVGGICGSSSSTNYCYVNCDRIIGDRYVAGISNSRVESSVAINGEISANSNLKRVTTSNNGSNNLAWVQTSMVLAGEKQPIPQDDAQNGTNTGLSTLKLQATYEGLGWDFTDTWAIQETESLPYLKMQTAPPYFTQVLKAGDTQLSGQCAEVLYALM